MKITSAFIFLLCIQMINAAIYPSYTEVINKFFDSYLHQVPQSHQLHFEKRPDGWHTAVSDYKGNEIKNELFWSKKENKFNTLSFPAVTGEDQSENDITRDNFINVFDRKYYDISPYYGYPGWDEDVINEYGENNNLPDSTLYAVGRAYSSYATSMLENFSGFANKKVKFQTAPTRNCLSEEQLKKFRLYAHKAIDKYSAVERLNPYYETVVGNISLKKAHDILSNYVWICIFQNEEEALKELSADLYDKFYLDFAKNMLASCETNGILFTNGDTDTFPLLYLQAYYNERPDVRVINLSLLQTDRYINLLRDPLYKAKPYPFSFSKEQISGSKLDVTYIQAEGECEETVGKLISDLKTDNNMIEVEGEKYPVVNCVYLKLPVKGDTLSFALTRQYLFKSHLMILDGVNENKENRPFHFAITCGPADFLGLEGNFSQEGLAYRMFFPGYNSNFDKVIETKKGYSLFMNQFTLSAPARYGVNESRMVLNYRLQMVKLADALREKQQQDSAMKVIDKSVEAFPYSEGQCDGSYLYYIKIWLDAGQTSKAVKYAKLLIKDFKNEKYWYTYDGLSYHYNKPSHERYLEYLNTLADEYSVEEIKNALKQ